MRRILILNGPNLNLLGTRKPEMYGSTTLGELDRLCTEWGALHGLDVETFQSNHEGVLIDRLHQAREDIDGIVLNPGALTHYSYALHDAIEAIGLPVVEVHISNIKERESWRAHSVVTPACVHTIYGRGVDGYRWAIDHLVHRETRPPRALEYATGDSHVGDLRLPDGEGPHPVAVLIHGGFWRHHWTRDTLDALAVDLAARGFATWNIEYRRVGMGGGYPATLQDVAAAIDHLDELAAEYHLDLQRVVVLGHSAGGQLALWAANRHRLKEDDPGAGPRVLPEAAVSLAGVTDLEAAETTNLGDGAVDGFLGKAPRDEAYRVASPLHSLPADRPHLIVHGTKDDRVPISFAHSYVEAARRPGTKVELIEINGADHFDPIAPTGPAWAAVVERLATL
ncbi:MAG: type II 3-dehydroquinate dehydratase [Acidimicrobiia bacterium]|nr:type II 3-dehydroquinate dehydratase [Acidimicrobiia bacterium]